MMTVKQIYTEDLQLAKALIKRDELTTRKFFYKQCYPLFKSIFDNYYTDCENCKEFIDEIYLLVLSPSKTTSKCQMENFRGESTLTSWLKSSCLFYCYKKYQRKERIHIINNIQNDNDDFFNDHDRLIEISNSSILNIDNINRKDVETILNLMSNKRYSDLIRLRYIEMKSNEETANILGLSMDNYYNVHKRAKSLYERVFRKEEAHG